MPLHIPHIPKMSAPLAILLLLAPMLSQPPLTTQCGIYSPHNYVHLEDNSLFRDPCPYGL